MFEVLKQKFEEDRKAQEKAGRRSEAWNDEGVWQIDPEDSKVVWELEDTEDEKEPVGKDDIEETEEAADDDIMEDKDEDVQEEEVSEQDELVAQEPPASLPAATENPQKETAELVEEETSSPKESPMLPLPTFQATNDSQKLEDLGLPEETVTQLDKVLKKEHGLILISGPMRSGRSTTIYSLLSRLDNNRKVVTLEDRPCFEVSNSCQIHTDPVRVPFDASFKAATSQQANVLMIDVFDDKESLLPAIKAAKETLVIASCSGAEPLIVLNKLFMLRVPPAELANVLEAIVSQRLYRRICPECVKEYTPDFAMYGIKGESAEILTEGNRHSFMHGCGCWECHHSGYQSKALASESFFFDDRAKHAIAVGGGIFDVYGYFRSHGVKSLWSDSLRLVKENITTIEEISEHSIYHDTNKGIPALEPHLMLT